MSELVNRLANLTAIRDRDALDMALVSAISDLLQPETCAIYRVVGEVGNEHWLTSAQLAQGQLTPTFDAAWSSLDLLPYLSDHPLRQKAVETQTVQHSDGEPSVAVFPIATGVEGASVLEVRTASRMPPDSLRLVTGVLRLYLNFLSLLDYGERDSLTELLNRKTFDTAFLKASNEQRLAAEVPLGERRATEASGSYWLVMIDIDHFKKVNDNYGHLIGDEVLLLLARLMRTHFRFHDQLYRFGGEEFVVLMRCNGEAEAFNVLERLRVTTEAHRFPQVGTITISVGFSEIMAGDTPSGAFERADQAVYYAKGHGRNQVCSYAALIAQGELAKHAENIGDMELF